MNINIETLRKTKGIGQKTLERIIEQHEIDNNIKSFKSKYVPSDKYKMTEDMNLWQGDCLELMSHIPDKSVDMVLADLPYGTTACSWDEVIPFEPLWSHYKRIIKDNGAIVLFGSEPFSTRLRSSNLDWYKYDWVWDKVRGVGFQLANIRPMTNHENIMVFGNKRTVYNPQKTKGKKRDKRGYHADKDNLYSIAKDKRESNVNDMYFPKSIVQFSNASQKGKVHPTQKPVDLLEYLIKTYTNEGMVVLDNTMGSGSTGVACKNLDRKFIGIELDEEYFDIARERILGDSHA